MKSNNNHPESFDDEADEYFFEATRLEVWEKLAINLKLKNAINKFAQQRKRRNRKLYAGGTVTMCIVALIIFGKMQQGFSVEHLGKSIAGKILIDKNIVQDTDLLKNPLISTSAAQTAKSTVKYTVKHIEDSIIGTSVRLHQPKNYYPDSQSTQPDQNAGQIPQLQLVSYPSVNGTNSTNAPALNKLPISIDENDIWDVLQKHVDRTYWRKQKLKDSLKELP